MISEIKGKLSRDGSNATDRSEDKLTGNIFGALRYMPFNEGLKPLLEAVTILSERSDEVKERIKRLDLTTWDDRIEFWPYDEEAELDLLLSFDEIMIGVEVKLWSSLSSDDSEELEEEENRKKLENTKHQLGRESRVLKKKVKDSDKLALLLFIAPEDKCASICKDTLKRDKMEKGIQLGYLSWEEILVRLEQIENEDEFRHLILEDARNLLKRKGFERFKSFQSDLETVEKIEDSYFVFNAEPSVEIEFNFVKEVEKDGYYEFR